MEIEPGDYRHYDLWKNPEVDDNGSEVPLPQTARIVRRSFGGAFLIVPKGSGCNASPKTYSGQHARISAFEFDAEIAKLITRLQRYGPLPRIAAWSLTLATRYRRLPAALPAMRANESGLP